ncbi:MAG: glycosyltransferase family 2 protein, partial [Muribaculaceae bacterium]|nr:glycosyltransferase family 2 protein [Muribaculaceae bacterium]
SIVTYHTDETELAAVVSDLYAAGAECIEIVDNSPVRRLEALCGRLGVDYTFTGHNVGYGAAHNISMRKSLAEDTRFHLVMNSDICLGPDVLIRIAEYMEFHPEVGQLIPRVNYPDGTLQPVVRLLPTPLDVIVRRFLPKNWMKARNERYTLGFWNHETTENIPYHQGSFMFFRTQALRDVGLFDERFFMYPEDIDLTRRMHEKYRTEYWPGVSIVHNHRAESRHSARMMFIHIVNMIRYFNKWGWFFDSKRRSINRKLLKHLE